MGDENRRTIDDPDDALREPDLVAVDDDEVGLLGLVVDPAADHVVAATDQLGVLLLDSP